MVEWVGLGGTVRLDRERMLEHGYGPWVDAAVLHTARLAPDKL
jgi:hypothetical protein